MQTHYELKFKLSFLWMGVSHPQQAKQASPSLKVGLPQSLVACKASVSGRNKWFAEILSISEKKKGSRDPGCF